MKRLVPCLLLLPFLTSCDMSQPEYYDAGYYHSVPPRAEVYGFDEHPHDYRHTRNSHHQGHKKIKDKAKHAKEHGHTNNTHGHDANNGHGVVIHPTRPQVHVNVQNNDYRHGKKKAPVTTHTSESETNVVVKGQS